MALLMPDCCRERTSWNFIRGTLCEKHSYKPSDAQGPANKVPPCALNEVFSRRHRAVARKSLTFIQLLKLGPAFFGVEFEEVAVIQVVTRHASNYSARWRSASWEAAGRWVMQMMVLERMGPEDGEPEVAPVTGATQ